MKRNNKQFLSNKNKKSTAYLNSVHTETTETDRRSLIEGTDLQKEHHVETLDVPPPFKGETKKSVTWADLSLTAKIITGLLTFVITVVTPAVWFASRINSEVSVLKDDVKDVKEDTKKIQEDTIRQSSRIDTLEKLLEYFRK